MYQLFFHIKGIKRWRDILFRRGNTILFSLLVDSSGVVHAVCNRVEELSLLWQVYQMNVTCLGNLAL